ncbi:hypothetical protein HY214_02095 [Candidatus Roizmanbacteria bacterium]|nr:hypothetical protein [Candidatus Roizmanbacteria bacterium]
MNSAEIQGLIESVKNETNPVLRGRLIHFLVKDKQLRIKDLSRELKIKESYLCHLLRLIKLPEIVVDGYYSGLISLSHLFIISRLSKSQEMAALYERVLTDSLTAQQTEFAIREILHGVKTKGEYLKQEELADLVKTPARGTKIKVYQSRIKSKCVIEITGSLFDTNRPLRLLLAKLGEWQKEVGDLEA